MRMRDALLSVIRSQVGVALGCTEPVAVALAAAYAARAIGGEVERVVVTTDPNVFKNGMGVYVPSTDAIGLDIAAAIGAIGGDPQRGLEVLASIRPEHKKKMEAFMQDPNAVDVSVEGDPQHLKITAKVFTTNGWGYAEIFGSHENLILLKTDKEVLYESAPITKNTTSTLKDEVLNQNSIAELIAAIETFTEEELQFLLDGAEANYRAALVGLKEAPGLGIGAKMHALMEKGLLADDLANKVGMYSAAASDARMRGLNVPITTTNGSGNQGISASVSIYVAAQELGITGVKRVRAMAISQMMTIMVKNSMGLLSSLCACTIAAAIGATSGIIYLYGGNSDIIENGVNNSAADILGIICDGAKPGCAIKIASSLANAAKHALYALEGLQVSSSNGIVGETAKESIANIGLISGPGMVGTGDTILEIMVKKKKCCS